MIDFHSHILPAIDDGSKNVEESVQLLQMLKSQGVNTVVATPHFYANHHTPSEFLQKRRDAYDRLTKVWTEQSPQILLGAEVRYYEGISRMQELSSLCIEGTKLLLLEMPFARWTEYAVSELVHLASTGKVVVLLAHVERYFSFQSADVWKRLIENGIIMQANASFFAELKTRRKAIKLLKERFIRLLGSDCHGVKMRSPQMDKALQRIEKKLGGETVERLIRRGRFFMETYRLETKN